MKKFLSLILGVLLVSSLGSVFATHNNSEDRYYNLSESEILEEYNKLRTEAESIVDSYGYLDSDEKDIARTTILDIAESLSNLAYQAESEGMMEEDQIHGDVLLLAMFTINN